MRRSYSSRWAFSPANGRVPFFPKELNDLYENQPSAFDDLQSFAPALACLGVLVLDWIASLVGLFRLKRWGAWLYLTGMIVALPYGFLKGFEVFHPIDLILSDIGQIISGLIIGVAFFSDAVPKKDAMKSETTPFSSPP